MVDRVMAVALQSGKAGLFRVGNQRHDIGMVDGHANGGDKFAGDQHVFHLLVGLNRHDIAGRLVFGDMLIA